MILEGKQEYFHPGEGGTSSGWKNYGLAEGAVSATNVAAIIFACCRGSCSQSSGMSHAAQNKAAYRPSLTTISRPTE